MSLSIALPFRAILWPLIGAATILILGRLLPNWLRRLAAAVFGTLSLLSLSALRPVEPARIGIPWEPINLFRTSPSFYPDALSVAAGIALAGVTGALVLGIRDRGQRTPWHALMLIALAGSVMTLLAANLVTLALGSALLDLAVIAIVLWVRTDDEQGRPTLAVAVPGVLSTSLLFFTGLWLDTSAGHTSLWARSLPGQTLQLIGIAGLLRMLIFPLHPQRLNAPQHAASVLLPVGTGIYLLARVQGLEPVLAGTGGFMTLGLLAALIGGLLVWCGGLTSRADREDISGIARLWSAGLSYQTGYAVVLALLFPKGALWPVLCLPVALGALAVWWDAGLPKGEAAGSDWFERVWHSTASQRARLYAQGIERFPVLERWPGLAAIRYLIAMLPVIALASIAGAPLTAGFRQRWPLYAALLDEGSPSLLLLSVADAFVVAGFWLVLGPTLKREDRRRSAPASIVAVGLLALLLVVAGVSADGFGLRPVPPSDVSVWGLGLFFVLPWLVGTWLARWRSHLADYAQSIQAIADLGWFYRAASWIGQRLSGLFYWLGKVGEGEGWWGWALIVLALGAVFLTAR
jgi:formate hydrogenlyase subunit 3/multisubunit Na+/H+ antiporter MnhD subunit